MHLWTIRLLNYLLYRSSIIQPCEFPLPVASTPTQTHMVPDALFTSTVGSASYVCTSGIRMMHGNSQGLMLAFAKKIINTSFWRGSWCIRVRVFLLPVLGTSSDLMTTYS